MNSPLFTVSGWWLLSFLVGYVLATLLLAIGKEVWDHHRHQPEAQPDIDPPTVQLRKIQIPTFGKPDLQKYDEAKFVIPLVCAAPTCQQPLKSGDDYFEIPIPNAGPGSATGVHVRCVMDQLVTPRGVQTK